MSGVNEASGSAPQKSNASTVSGLTVLVSQTKGLEIGPDDSVSQVGAALMDQSEASQARPMRVVGPAESRVVVDLPQHVKDLLTPMALKKFEELLRTPEWQVYERPNAALSRTGYSLEHYPLKKCTPSMLEHLLLEVEQLSWWCPLPGCSARSGTGRQSNSERARIFSDHWMSDHVDPQLVGLSCEDTYPGSKCRANPTLVSLRQANDHWRLVHQLTSKSTGEQREEWMIRKKIWFSHCVIHYGVMMPGRCPEAPPVQFEYRTEKQGLLAGLQVSDMRVHDMNPRRHLQFEGFFRKLNGPEDLPLGKVELEGTSSPR